MCSVRGLLTLVCRLYAVSVGYTEILARRWTSKGRAIIDHPPIQVGVVAPVERTSAPLDFSSGSPLYECLQRLLGTWKLPCEVRQVLSKSRELVYFLTNSFIQLFQ